MGFKVITYTWFSVLFNGMYAIINVIDNIGTLKSVTNIPKWQVGLLGTAYTVSITYRSITAYYCLRKLKWPRKSIFQMDYVKHNSMDANDDENVYNELSNVERFY